MSTFLRAVAPAPPVGWIGDGVTSTTFTGSPIGFNQIRLDAPAGTDLDGKGNSFIQSANMVISGHIPVSTTVALPLSIDRVTCSFIKAATTTEHIDVFLTSQPAATVAITDITNPLTPVALGSGVVGANGKFFGSFVGTAKVISINVTPAVGSTGFAAVTQTANVVDYVNISSCTYSLATNILTVQATSSDWFKHPTTPPTMTAVGFGALTFNTLGVASGSFPVTSPLPPTVTVTSTTGGSDVTYTGIVP
jgi:hypothetical protein